MIIRSRTNKNFTVVDNVWVKDKGLSTKAKGIFVYLLTLPNDWDLHVSELVTHFTDGEKGIRTGLQELMKRGYLFCIPRRSSDNSRFLGNDYVIMENPVAELQHAEKRHTVKDALLSTEKKLSTKRDIHVELANYKEPIEVLNNMTGRSFRTDNLTYLGEIRARVKEGSPIKEVCEVVKFICKQRMGTEWEKFLRPSTVFNKTKYESYVQEYKYLTKDGKCAILYKDKKVSVLRDLA